MLGRTRGPARTQGRCLAGKAAERAGSLHEAAARIARPARIAPPAIVRPRRIVALAGREAEGQEGGEEEGGGACGHGISESKVPFLAGGTMSGIGIDLTGRKALVTGGSRGPAAETAAEVEKRGRKALLYKVNVARTDRLEGMFEAIQQEFGRLDILVSNAASGVIKPAMELTRRHWEWTMDINASALIPLAQHAARLMGAQGGHIIAVSSLGAVRAIPNYAAVGASKAALESLVRHLAIELAPVGIRVNAISAGVVDTDALKHFSNRSQLLEESARRTPAGRLTEPADVADTALFLASPLADMMIGQTVVVDGGYSIMG